MTDWLILCSNSAAGGVRVIIGMFLIGRLLSNERPDKNGVTAALAGGAGIAAIAFLAGLPDFCHMILEIVCLWLAVRAGHFQRADGRMSLFIAVFYEIAVSLWQFLAAAWAGVIFHSAAFLDYGAGRGQFAVWLVPMLLTAGALYVRKHSNMTGKEGFRPASVLTVAGFLAVVSLSQQTVLTIAEDTMDMWTILAVILIMALLAFNMNRQYETEKELTRLKTEQAELLERDYTALNNAYAVNAKLFHDFHNHIGVIRRLLSHHKTEEAARYLDELQAPIQEMTDTVWTGDETIDYLINSKAAAAEDYGIAYQAEVEFPRRTNLRSADLCAILGNLLDNALEAARQTAKQEERFVRLTIRRINQMLIIKVENSFTAPPVWEDGALRTRKEENGLHGWGLKSAQTAAEKYDGMVRTSYADNTFRAVATLSYRSVSGKNETALVQPPCSDGQTAHLPRRHP